MDIFIFTMILLLVLFLYYLLIKGIAKCIKENPQELNFSEDQKNIRRSWKKTFLICYTSSLLYLLTLADQTNELEWAFIVGVTLATILGVLISAYATAYFAFKKFGTKWIGFSVFLTPIIFLREMIDTLQNNFLASLFFIILSIPTAYFWYHSIHLYQLNRSLKKKQKQETMQIQPN